MNPYRVLGVEPGDDEHAIRDAYRRYVAIHHPDRGGDATTFQEGIDAFRRLTDLPKPVRGTLGTHHRQNVVVRFVRRRIPKRRPRRVL